MQTYQYMFGADYIFAEYFTLLIDLGGKDKFYLSYYTLHSALCKGQNVFEKFMNLLYHWNI